MLVSITIDPQAINRDRGSSDTYCLYQKNMDVDILLNLDEQILKIGIVGQIDDKHEYKFKGIEKTNKFGGWIPHFNFCHTLDTDFKEADTLVVN